MVNKKSKVAFKIRHLFFLPVIFFSTLINAQNISKHYSSFIQENGTLYFITPKSGFNNKKIKGEFIYDITYLAKTMVATVNFSYFDSSNRNIDSITFLSSPKNHSTTVKKIFIETKKKKWHYRYTFQMSFHDLHNFFYQSTQPTIVLHTKQGLIQLDINHKLWKKQSSIVQKILTVIKYNE